MFHGPKLNWTALFTKKNEWFVQTIYSIYRERERKKKIIMAIDYSTNTPLKTNMSPKKGTMSVGNTSSYRSFSGAMLVFMGGYTMVYLHYNISPTTYDPTESHLLQGLGVIPLRPSDLPGGGVGLVFHQPTGNGFIFPQFFGGEDFYKIFELPPPTDMQIWCSKAPMSMMKRKCLEK